MNSLPWYTARSAGLLSWALVSASVLWGLALSSRIRTKLAGRPWILDLHRFLGGLAVVFTGIHVVSILADTYVSFSLVQVLVPFTSTWRPSAVAWGIVAAWLLVAVEVTSLLKQRMNKKTWHALHLMSYGVFLLGTIHGLTAGTDTGLPWLRGVMIGVTALVVVLTAYRVSTLKHQARPSSGRAGSAGSARPRPAAQVPAAARSTSSATTPPPAATPDRPPWPEAPPWRDAEPNPWAPVIEPEPARQRVLVPPTIPASHEPPALAPAAPTPTAAPDWSWPVGPRT